MGFILRSLCAVTPCPNCSEEILPSLAEIGCKLEDFIEKVMLTSGDLFEEERGKDTSDVLSMARKIE